MTASNTPSPTLKELEDSVRKPLNELVLNKGGAQPNPKALEMAVTFLALKAQRKGVPPPPSPITTPMPQDVLNTDVARQKLGLLPTEELEAMASMHISFKEECPVEKRRSFYQTQDLALEILKISQTSD